MDPLPALTWRPSTPEAVEDDLAALWREAAQQGPLSRALLCNLVVFDRSGACAPGSPPSAHEALVRHVVERHPARTIIVEHQQAHGRLTGPESVAVSVLIRGSSSTADSGRRTHPPSRPRYGVEFIAVRAVCASRSLPSLLRRLLRGDVPTSIWSLDDVAAAPLPPVLEMGRQLIFDSARFASVPDGFSRLQEILAAAHPPDLADLNWVRLAPVRAAVIDVARRYRLRDPAAGDVTVHHAPAHGAAAALLAGWFASRLGWWPKVTAADAGDGLVGMTLRVPHAVTVRLDEARRVTVSEAAATVLLGGTPRSDDDIVAGELGRLAVDRTLRDALRGAAGLRTAPSAVRQ